MQKGLLNNAVGQKRHALKWPKKGEQWSCHGQANRQTVNGQMGTCKMVAKQGSKQTNVNHRMLSQEAMAAAAIQQYLGGHAKHADPSVSLCFICCQMPQVLVA